MPEKRVWPVTVQLEAWFLYDKIATEGPNPLPEDFVKWIGEFRQTPILDTHARLFQEYKTFADIFYGPEEK